MKKRDRIGVGFALLVAVAVVALLSWMFRGDPETAVPGSKPGKRLSALEPGLVGKGNSRLVKLAPAKRAEREVDPYEEWDTQTILDRFGVPAGRLEEASLPEALDYLREAFKAHGGRGIEFRIEGGGGFPITCEFDNVGASSLLELVAGLGGYDIAYGDGEVVFRRKAPVPNFPMHEMRLDPSFLNTLDNRDDDGVSIAAKLARFGLSFDEGAQIEVEEFDDGTEMAVILNSAEQNDRLLAAYQFLTNESRLGTVLLRTKALSVPTGEVQLETESYQDADFQTAIRALSQTDGAKLLTTPSVMMLPGQTARVEVIREIVFPIEWDSGGNPISFEIENVGLMIDVGLQVFGLDQLQMEGRVLQSLVEGQTLEDLDPQELSAAATSSDQIRKLATEFEGELFDGNTAGFTSAEEDGVGVQQFFTLQRVLPSGHPLIK